MIIITVILMSLDQSVVNNMKKVNSYNWILRIVDHTGERYELKLDYTLSNMRKLTRIIVTGKQIGRAHV